MVLNSEEDIIKNLYYSNITIKSNREYDLITKKIRKIEYSILKELNEKGKNNFEKYLEYITQRESIEAQEEFKRGFRTALKTLLETLK